MGPCPASGMGGFASPPECPLLVQLSILLASLKISSKIAEMPSGPPVVLSIAGFDPSSAPVSPPTSRP